MISTYTPNDDIRAVLGVDEPELTDETLALAVYDLQLQDALSDVYEELEEVYVELTDKKKANELDPATNPALTKKERKVLGLTQVLSTYLVASFVAPSMPMFALKRETDGKAEGDRFPNAYEKILAEVESQVLSLTDKLVDALGEIGEVVPQAPATVYIIGTAGLGIDPVTGA